MDDQYKKQGYRSEIQSEKERIRPEEVFGTQEYHDLMQSMMQELTDGRPCKIHLYDAPWEKRLGWCDGKRVAVNWGNALTAEFPTMAQKNVSLIGVLGHECGHKNYSDFALRRKYLEGILDGIWYPHPPEAEDMQETEFLEQIRDYFERKDQDALALIVQVAAYLHNVLEDIYVEEKMCARFPGSVRKGILLNRERNAEWIPSLRKLQEEGEDALSIMMNLCGQYALSGRINNWDGLENDLFETLKNLMPVIRGGCVKEGDSSRYLTVNRIILKIWKYLYEIICEIEKQREEQEKEKENEEQEKEKQENGKDTGENEPGNGQEDADSTPETSSAMQEYLAHFVSMLPQAADNEAEAGGSSGFPKDVVWNGAWNQETSDAQSVYAVTEKTEDAEAQKESAADSKADRLKADDAEEQFQEILWSMAKNRVDRQINTKINLLLQKEMDEIVFDEGHRKVKKVVCRQYDITDQQKMQYREYQEQVKKVQRRLMASLLPVLQEQRARTERYLFMGRQIDMRSIASPQGAIFRKRYPGKKVDMAVFILVDMSESMTGQRMEQAKLAVSCLYDFCRKAGIPVAIYGHHTDGFSHRKLEDETVYLHCCAEFEPDRNDGFRIAALLPDGANRDGVALKFAGERLLKRKEAKKLLVLISDGLPNSNQYKGEMAKRDLSAIRKELMDGGIVFTAAAIGADKEKIREIYESSFLDISEIERLPVTLTKQIVKQIRRNA